MEQGLLHKLQQASFCMGIYAKIYINKLIRQ